MINVYTEEEAKKKWCPMDNRGECVASECMAWRYVETLNPKTLLFVNVAGYCGMGGKP
jgi:hypothetical protein